MDMRVSVTNALLLKEMRANRAKFLVATLLFPVNQQVNKL